MSLGSFIPENVDNAFAIFSNSLPAPCTDCIPSCTLFFLIPNKLPQKPPASTLPWSATAANASCTKPIELDIAAPTVGKSTSASTNFWNAVNPLAISVKAPPAPCTELIPSATLFFLIPNKVPKNPPASVLPVSATAAKALCINPTVVDIDSPNTLKSTSLSTSFWNSVNPTAILVKALPAPITDSIPFLVALGLNAFPNTAPNIPVGVAASPPAWANAVVIPDNTSANCTLWAEVHSNFWYAFKPTDNFVNAIPAAANPAADATIATASAPPLIAPAILLKNPPTPPPLGGPTNANLTPAKVVVNLRASFSVKSTFLIAVKPGANACSAKPTAPNAAAPATIGITPRPAKANTPPMAVSIPACIPISSNVVPAVAFANGV